jgi:hypothetical protein
VTVGMEGLGGHGASGRRVAGCQLARSGLIRNINMHQL